MYAKNNYDYLAISKSKEYYATYRKVDVLRCKQTKDFLLCPEIQFLHPRSLKPVCEMQLFHELPAIPKDR